MNLKKANQPTPIPKEWSDPKLVMPHLADELLEWLTRLRGLDQDLAVLQGALDEEPKPGAQTGVSAFRLPERERLLEGITTIRGRLQEIDHDIGGRAHAFKLIAEHLNHG